MCVAVSRGAEFTRFKSGINTLGDALSMGPLIGPGLENDKMAIQALHDVEKWLGFLYSKPYIETLFDEKEKIFERRTY